MFVLYYYSCIISITYLSCTLFIKDNCFFNSPNSSNSASSSSFLISLSSVEILPKDFLLKLVNVIEVDDRCGFVQANHRANIKDSSAWLSFSTMTPSLFIVN